MVIVNSTAKEEVVGIVIPTSLVNSNAGRSYILLPKVTAHCIPFLAIFNTAIIALG
jgi:hypothetical protein